MGVVFMGQAVLRFEAMLSSVLANVSIMFVDSSTAVCRDDMSDWRLIICISASLFRLDV
jgi:hypothetical protein